MKPVARDNAKGKIFVAVGGVLRWVELERASSMRPWWSVLPCPIAPKHIAVPRIQCPLKHPST